MIENEEEWRYVPNFPEYVVSNLGQIHKTGSNRGRPLDLVPDEDGVIFVRLQPEPHKLYRFRLDRLVAAAFLFGFSGKPMIGEVVHIDGDQSNCRADNLMWSEE